MALARSLLKSSPALVATGLMLTACAGSSGETGGLALPPLGKVGIPSVDLSKVELPKVELPKVELPKVELPEAAGPVVGTPTEVYTRIAAAAMSCWFGAEGPLKARYIYNAEAESPARGGRAEIVIHERNAPAPGLDVRGPRALKVDIQPEGDTAKVTFENYKFPIETGQAYHRDVDRWASGNTNCQPAGAIAAAPAAATAAIAAQPAQQSATSRSKSKKPVQRAAPAK